MSPIEETHKAWHEKVHAEYFDGFAPYSNRGIRELYETFNEIKLFQLLKPTIAGTTFLEVGCASGELYRYLRLYHPEIQYQGIDISQPAIDLARAKYPRARFTISDGTVMPSVTVKKLGAAPCVLFARDVVLHQKNPFDFLRDLVAIPSELAILRIRTRDTGDTVLDPALSCQWNYGLWVPYMILNIDETIERIRKTVRAESIYAYKYYLPLGGVHRRFLPKECYYAETGTAETAIAVKLSGAGVDTKPAIIVKNMPEDYSHLSVFDKKLSFLLGKLKRKVIA